ncbi:MAG: T9SS type A sorting domain-containing protein [Bacteroidetes bacterium]|nr:T9SS type A sorting domain-containing protein [Bacteroidota bacterium]
MVDTYMAGTGLLTQGFVQSDQNIATSFVDGNHCFLFNVFPNPAYDYINIDVFKTCSLELSIAVFNIYGAQQNISLRSLKTENKEEYSLLIDNLSEGIYFVKIYSEEKGLFETFKFLKL